MREVASGMVLFEVASEEEEADDQLENESLPSTKYHLALSSSL